MGCFGSDRKRILRNPQLKLEKWPLFLLSHVTFQLTIKVGLSIQLNCRSTLKNDLFSVSWCFICFLKFYSFQSISLHLQSQTFSYQNNIISTGTIAVTGTITKITKIPKTTKNLCLAMASKDMSCLEQNPQCMNY